MSKPSRRHRNPVHHEPDRGPLPWEPVWQGDGEAAASIVAGGLEADGIRAQVQGVRAAGGIRGQFLARNTWSVFVLSSHADEARRLLRKRHDDPNIVTSNADLTSSQIATLKFAVVGLIAAAVVVLLVFVRYGV